MEFEIEIGIRAGEIMKEDFPVIDSSLTLEDCLKILDKNYESCVVLHDGTIHSVLNYDYLLKAFLARKRGNTKISEFEPMKNFVVVSAETDMFKVINSMKKKSVDFVVVKGEHNIGLITKREIAEVNQVLFDSIESQSVLA